MGALVWWPGELSRCGVQWPGVQWEEGKATGGTECVCGGGQMLAGELDMEMGGAERDSKACEK